MKKDKLSYHRGIFPQRAFHAKARICVILLLTLLPLLVLLSNVRTAYAQPKVITDTVDPGPASATLHAEVNPNGKDTWWVILMHDEEGNHQTWVPVGCTGERDADAGPTSVQCSVYGLTPDHGYGDMIIACWGSDPMSDACQYASDPEYQPVEGAEVSWWTPPLGNGLATTTTSNPVQSYTMIPIVTNVLTNLHSTNSIQSYTMMTIMTNVLSGLYSSKTSPPSGFGFDFGLSISPSIVTVSQGETAHYLASVMYSDPSYAGTMINVQLTGLGPGMDYQLSQSGDLTITTLPATPAGTYTFTVVGSALGVTHETGGTLIVTQVNSVSTAPVTIITLTTAAPSLVATVTSVVTQTATIQSSPTSTEASTSNMQTSIDVIGLLQENSLLIIAILMIALVAVMLRGRRRSTSLPPQTQPATINVTYCSHCGTQNPATNQFCRKCGSKLVNTTNSPSQA